MGKKKKQETELTAIQILKEVDKNLDCTHDDIMKEIEELQYRLYIEDRKARKRMRKRLRREQRAFSDNREQVEVRKKVIAEMEGTDLLARIQNLFAKLSPIIAIIGRLVAALISAILSITEVKVWIKPETLQKMDTVYNFAMALGTT